MTKSPSSRVYSCITTAFAPRGTGAPVRMRTHSPGPTVPSKATPARLSPIRRKFRAGLGKVGGAHSEAIANRAIERRIIAVGDDVFGEDATESAARVDAEVESFAFRQRRRAPK